MLVIGSGFGGSVAALRLTEKGYRVGVLEAGRRFADDELPRTSWDVRRFLWAPKLGCKGIQRIHPLRDVIVLAGAGVGGGSLVYANTLYEPKSDAFYRDPQWADITDWRAELAPFYDQARRMLGVVVNPTITAADEVYRKVAEEMGVGHTFARTPVGVFFGRNGTKEPGVEVDDPFFGGVGPRRAGCKEVGECITGCRHNAKNTLVKNYLYRVHRDLLEDLLETGAPQTAEGVAAVRAAGLEPDAPCVLVAAVATDAPADDGALTRAARTLATAVRRHDDPLTVTRHGEIVLVRAGVRDERVALRASLAKACERTAAQGVALAVGVSTVQDGPSSLGAAYREASQAVRRVAASGGVLSLPDLSAFEFLTLRNDAVARRLIAPEIERFVAEDREHGGQLIDTLLAYAECDLNAKAAAERLLIHVNTAHYRLGRIEEKTGCDLRRLPDVIDLLIAVRLADA